MVAVGDEGTILSRALRRGCVLQSGVPSAELRTFASPAAGRSREVAAAESRREASTRTLCTWSGATSFKAYVWSAVVAANALLLARHRLASP